MVFNFRSSTVSRGHWPCSIVNHRTSLRGQVILHLSLASNIIKFVRGLFRTDLLSLSFSLEESYFKVTCGSLEGKLIWQKFVCPGINVRCIRLDRSHHELITPKELVREAGKQTLKDWKRAIRINSKMLRYSYLLN